MPPLTAAVMHVLLALAGGDKHGYAILKDVQQHSGSRLRFGPGTIYGTLQRLMEAGWVRTAGRRDSPGRPLLYATTPDFLTHFGLASRKDLPGIDDLKAAGLLDPLDEAALQLELDGDLEDELESETEGD